MVSSKVKFLLRNLLANPFNCNCHLAWLGDWLRKKRIVTGNPRCQKPYFLKEIPIQDVAIQDFTCDDGKKIHIWTFCNFHFLMCSYKMPTDPKVQCFKKLHLHLTVSFYISLKILHPLLDDQQAHSYCIYTSRSLSCLCLELQITIQREYK